MSFGQAMVVPTLLSVGLGALLVARHMPVSEALYAQAPAAESAASGGTDGPLGAPNRARNVAAAAGAKAAAVDGLGANAAGAAAARARPGADRTASGGSLGTNSPEFGGRGPDGSVIRAITEGELALKAVESSGREDPFMSLLPPDPGQIVPPQVDFGPLAAPPAPIAPPSAAPPTPPPPPVVATPKPIALATPTPKPEDRPFGGDRPPQVGEPQWLIRGIISTGLERVALLEGREEQVTARVGDVLSDGSRIEAVSQRGVTFIRQGRRFVKVIGG